jgi:hypothetical protein
MVMGKKVNITSKFLDLIYMTEQEMGMGPMNMCMKMMPGKHKDVPDEKFDSQQLAMGIEVEKEHTDHPHIAKEIAKDHLAEIPDYYTRLKKMEDEGKAALKEGQWGSDYGDESEPEIK